MEFNFLQLQDIRRREDEERLEIKKKKTLTDPRKVLSIIVM